MGRLMMSTNRESSWFCVDPPTDISDNRAYKFPSNLVVLWNPLAPHPNIAKIKTHVSLSSWFSLIKVAIKFSWINNKSINKLPYRQARWNEEFTKFKVLLLLEFHKSLSMIGYIIEVNRSNLQNFKFCEFDHSKPCH